MQKLILYSINLTITIVVILEPKYVVWGNRDHSIVINVKASKYLMLCEIEITEYLIEAVMETKQNLF